MRPGEDHHAQAPTPDPDRGQYPDQVQPRNEGSAGEVFRAFLFLGLTSFGGPVAHLAYFRNEFVARRRWLSEQAYADLVALCQFLPGPASSQVGFALGLMRAGYPGAVVAFLAFTLPSAVLMTLFALGAYLLDGPTGEAILHALKIVAVAIVAHAVWGMAGQLCPDRRRAGIALAAVCSVVLVGGTAGQVGAIALGAAAGFFLCESVDAGSADALSITAVTRRAGLIAFVLFAVLLPGLPLLAWAVPSTVAAMLDVFYRAGALVFGGGHVVLPLLEADLVQSGRLAADDFLAGYGAAQAIPGPLFTFAAYLGAVMMPGAGAIVGAATALVAIFLPGFLLLVAVLPWWHAFRRLPSAQRLMRGANAAVVGILGAALYQPVWTSAIAGPRDFLLALTGLLLLSVWRLPAWLVVVALVGAGIAIRQWG